jgi:hypothetical protein
MTDPGQSRPVLHKILLVQTELTINGFYNPDLVIIIVDIEFWSETMPEIGQRAPVAPQQPDAEGMKRGNNGAVGRRRVAQQVLDSFTHLPGGLVRECDGENARPGHVMRADNVGDSVRNHPGLSAACARQQQQRALNVSDRLTLLRI